MQCGEFEDLLNEVLDERRRPEWDAELSLHRETCACCRQLASTYDRLLDGFYALTTPDVPDDMALRVVAEMRPTAAPRRRWAIGTAALATAAALLIAVLPIFRGSAEPQPGTKTLARNDAPPKPAVQRSPLAQLPQMMPEFLTMAGAPDGDPYAGLAKETGQGMATVMLYVPGFGGGRGIIDAEAGESPWAVQMSEGLRPITNSVSETFDVLLQGLPVSQLAARS
jgi:hypothetical protein